MAILVCIDAYAAAHGGARGHPAVRDGSQVFVHFHHDGQTLPVDIEELKQDKIRPIQVFEVAVDPIKNR